MSEEWKHAKWVSGLGAWAWLIGLVAGVGYLIWGIVRISAVSALLIFGFGIVAGPFIWAIIGGIVAIIISLFIIRPKFSKRCAEKDWDTLLNWVMSDGFRFPWMLFWGIMLHIFGWYWGGLAVTIPSLVLIFAGPTKFEWKK
ncbi:MAG: hypothetical protein ACXAAI_04750 [Promethearchaeota archaeon]|jgi:hypothetical protein